MRKGYWTSIALLLFLIIGCGSSSKDSPVSPSGDEATPFISGLSSHTQSDSRYLWGFWTIHIKPSTGTAEIIPIRAAEMHLNTVKFLEDNPCTDCLSIGNLKILEFNELEVDLTLIHPFPGNNKLTGFDVRGIFISACENSFPVNDRWITLSNNFPRLRNPDGYTSLFNPVEFPETLPVPASLKYYPGDHSMPVDGLPFTIANLNPFIAYGKDEPRRMFEAGGVETRTVRIFNPWDEVRIAYAVDACWTPVDGQITDPITQFPPEANCLEAYQVNISVDGKLDPSVGNSVPIEVEVFDHQGLDTISSVTVESPDLFSGELNLQYSTVTGDGGYLFTGDLTPEIPQQDGNYPILVRVEDTEPDENLGQIDAWNVGYVYYGSVGDTGWAVTWGGTTTGYNSYTNSALCAAVDINGNIFVGGDFEEEVDLDPGPGEDKKEAQGPMTDATLSKFSSDGEYLWGVFWGSPKPYTLSIIATDSEGNVYAAGKAKGTTDFDPGPGKHVIHDSYGTYISKFSPDGEHLGVIQLGDIGVTELKFDNADNMYVLGSFQETVDFDPGPGEAIRTVQGDYDAYLSMFNPDWQFVDVFTWNGTGSIYAHCMEFGNYGQVFISGTFRGTIDLDPGPGVDNYFSNQLSDVFLLMFTHDGTIQWIRAWGSPGVEFMRSMSIDSLDTVYVVGNFSQEVDFDPGDGDDIHMSNGLMDNFLSKFNTDGIYQGGFTWGNDNFDFVEDVECDEIDNLYVAGYFSDTIDFDPGPGEDFHNAGDYFADIYLSKFSSDGTYIWTRTWGSTQGDSCYDVALDGSDSIYLVGEFWKTMDFDPGPGIDEHVSHGSEDAFLLKVLPDGYW